MKLRGFWNFITQLINAYSVDRIASLSAALAYYTTFSLAPVLVICITIAGWFVGTENANTQILQKTGELLGTEPASQLQLIVQHLQHVPLGLIGRLIGIGVLIFGTLGMFTEMEQGLNSIWCVKAKPDRSWLVIIHDRIFPFIVVLFVAAILLAFLLLSLLLTSLMDYLIPRFGFIITITLLLNSLLSFFIITFLFAMLFKVLPDVVIYWQDVWLGALITAALFTFGKFLLGLYFKYSQVASLYGASGSLIIILIWIYYSAQIFFIGAEITKLIATKAKKPIIPKHHSMIITK